LESPGKDAQVTRLLLEAGARDDPSEPPRDWRAVELPKGLLLLPGLLHRGFDRVLRGLRPSFDARPHLRPTACPLAVCGMFDKLFTAITISKAGVPVPDMLTFRPTEYADACGAALACGWDTAYVKLNA